MHYQIKSYNNNNNNNLKFSVYCPIRVSDCLNLKFSNCTVLCLAWWHFLSFT